MKRNTMYNLKIAGIIFFLIQFVLSIVAVAFAVASGSLNAFFIFWIVLILVLFLFVSAVFIISRSKFRVIIGTSFSVIMTIVIAAVSFSFSGLAGENSRNGNIHNKNYSLKYYILVKSDNPAEQPESIKDYKIGIEKSMHFDAAQKALNDLSIYFDSTLNAIAYNNYQDMLSAFIAHGECSAMLIDSETYKEIENSYAARNDNISNYVKKLGEINV